MGAMRPVRRIQNTRGWLTKQQGVRLCSDQVLYGLKDRIIRLKSRR